jgi:hypothetical protein
VGAEEVSPKERRAAPAIFMARRSSLRAAASRLPSPRAKDRSVKAVARIASQAALDDQG